MTTDFSHRITFALLIGTALSCAPAQRAEAPAKSASAAAPTLPEAQLSEHTTLTGTVAHRDLRLPTTIIVRDQQRHCRQTQTDEQGHYQLDISTLTTPLRLSAVESGGNNCLLNNQARAIYLSAIVPSAQSGKENTGNINPFIDRIASDMAAVAGYLGPQQLSDDTGTPILPAATWKKANTVFHASFDAALKRAGVASPTRFDPFLYPVA